MQHHLQDVINRSREGSKEAFRTLVDHYQQQAFTLTFRILCDEEEAKDAVQEGFVKIWNSLNVFDPSRPFSPWLCRIMTHAAVDRIRKIRRRNEVSMDQVEPMVNRICSGETDLSLDNREIARLIGFLSRELPEKQRLVFILRDIQEMDSAEVGEALGLSATSIKSNLYHARKTIRRKMEKIFEQEMRSR